MEQNGNSEQKYIYKWDYESQLAFDRQQARKQKRKSAITYAIGMVFAFAICIALLLGVMIFAMNTEDFLPHTSHDSTSAMSIADVSELCSPSTVLITGTSQTAIGYGTGFFIHKDGYIATNYHVVEGFTQSLTVKLYSGEELPATLVGYYDIDDLAVLKVEKQKGKDYPVVSIGDSDALRVGDTLIPIGNPSGEDGAWTTTSGIVSALNRTIVVDDVSMGVIAELHMIQTDAPLNPGNSGGPIFNDRGEVVGIATRKKTEYEAFGLALPINGAIEVLEAIMRDGNADAVDSKISRSRPTLGITCFAIARGESYSLGSQTWKAAADGVMVRTVSESGGAYGILQAADIITAIDGVRVHNLDELTECLYKYKRGTEVELRIYRGEEELRVNIRLGIVK